MREEVLPALPEKYDGIMRAAEHHLRAGTTPSLVDRVNRMLLVNYAQRRRSTVTRGWPLKGGLEAWRAEVLASRRWSPFRRTPRTGSGSWPLGVEGTYGSPRLAQLAREALEDQRGDSSRLTLSNSRSFSASDNPFPSPLTPLRFRKPTLAA